MQLPSPGRSAGQESGAAFGLAPSLLVAAALVAVLAAWLFLPHGASSRGTPPLRVVLVDASASVARDPAWLGWVRSELRAEIDAAEARGEELAIAAFAEGVATHAHRASATELRARLEGRSGAPLDPRAGLDPRGTRLADGLAAARELLAGTGGRLTVLGPFTYTGASPAAVLRQLRSEGVELERRAPPRPELGDLGLLELSLAPRIEAGAELVALARLVWRPGLRPPARAVLTVEVDGGEVDGGEVEGGEVEGGDARRSVELALSVPGAGGEFELPLACGPAGAGRNLLRARCRIFEGPNVGSDEGPDFFPENDRVSAETLAEGARVIGLVAQPEQRAAAEAWLVPAGRSSLAGLQLVFLEPREVARALSGLAALVSFDLPPAALPEPLAGFVADGGGWLALSGWKLFEEWIPGEEGTSLARMLPCEPAERTAARRDVVLLVDGSGSMEGAPFEAVRAAALELVSAALPSDRVSLRFFTVQLEPEQLLKPRVATPSEDLAAAREAARDLLALRSPTGTTFLLRSLREFTASIGENETLAFLLTDGRERDAVADEVGEAREVARAFAAKGARLVVVAVGEAHLELLSALAGGEAEVRSGDTLEDLEAVFRRELAGARVAEGELAVLPAPRASGSLADEIESAAAAPRELPPLERCVRNRLRAGAVSLWRSEGGGPILAVARAGLGRTALFASCPAPGWASRYGPAEFEGLLRWLARGGAGRVLPRARLEDGRLLVSGLDGLGLDPGAVPPVLQATLEAPSDPSFRRAVDLWPPSALGRDVLATREAPIGFEVPEDALLRLGGGGERSIPVELELADELAWRERPVPPTWLEPAAPLAASRGAHGADSHRFATRILWLALGLLFGGGLVLSRGQGIRLAGR